MKIKAYTPLFVALAALCGAVLRGLNLIHGYEPGTHLPVRGDVSETALIVLSVLAAAVLLIWARTFRADRGTPFEDAFSGAGTLFKMTSVVCGLVMAAAGAFGLYLAAAGDPSAPMAAKLPQFPLWLLAILTGGCFVGIAAALGRRKITESVASLTIVPMFWACFDLIITFKDNGASPFVGLYGFELLAAILLTYAFYALAGFLYGTGSPARFVFSAGLAVFFCLTCVGGAAVALATGGSTIVPSAETAMRYACFSASSLWLLAMLALLSRSRAKA